MTLKKGRVFFIWSALEKTQWRVKTLRYNPCEDTPTAATIAVTTGGASLLQ